jgi:hypothetical protein
MLLVPIQVECYAGYKADETPRRFHWEQAWIEVVEVLDRWYQGAGNPEWPRSDYFKLAGADGHHYLVKHDQESDEWFFLKRW